MSTVLDRAETFLPEKRAPAGATRLQGESTRSSTTEACMIPDDNEYLSLLMGAPGIPDTDLESLGIEILQRFGSETRGLRVPADCLTEYRQLVRQHMTSGFWNDLVGRDAIYFLFKLADGTVKEFTLSEANTDEIAVLCSTLNGDPIEKTSDLPRYFASNPFYRDAMVALYGASSD